MAVTSPCRTAPGVDCGMLGRVSPPPPPRAVHARTTRQQRIADHVLAAGSASAAELVELTGVSLMTVHRDVDELARRGLVRKYRGGCRPSRPRCSSRTRLPAHPHRAEKARVADAALAMVEPGSSIMVDDSTTALALVELLEDVGPLTVVTNYLPALELLKAMPEVRLIALGGTTRAPTTRSAASPPWSRSRGCR